MASINKVDSIEKLDQLFQRSYNEPVVIFKHSLACGMSAHVLEMVSEIEGELNLIAIQQNRDLSNEVAIRTGYTHQSPQVFVIADGKPVYHATHYGIDPQVISDAIDGVLTA